MIVHSAFYFGIESNSEKWFVKRFILCRIFILIQIKSVLLLPLTMNLLIIIFHFAYMREESILVKRIDMTYEWNERQTDIVERHTNIGFIMLWAILLQPFEIVRANWRAKPFGNKRKFQSKKILSFCELQMKEKK